MRNPLKEHLGGAAAIAFAVMLNTIAPSAWADEARLVYNNHCRTCHSLNEGDHRLGPSLANLFGKQAGTAEGYSYSSAFENAGFIWDAERMDAFLANPDQAVPGNNMNPYQGLSDPDIRALIIEVLGG